MNWKRWALNVGLAIVAIVGGYFAIRYVLGFLLPFLLAIVLAMLIEPLVSRMESVKIPRSVAVVIAMTLSIGSLGLIVFWGLSQLIKELMALSRDLPVYYDDMVWRFSNFLDWAHTLQERLPEPVRSAIELQEAELGVLLASWARQIVDVLLDLFRMLPSIFVILAVSFIATFFISRDRQAVSEAWWNLIPDRWHARVSTTKGHLVKSTFGFLAAQLMLVSVTTVLTTIGFFIIGGRYAVTMGIVAGILDLVPYVGPSLVIGPWTAICIVRGDFLMAGKLIAVLSVVALVRQYLEARIIGDKAGLHPLIILFSLYAGVRLFGPVGFVIGPLVAIFIRAILIGGLIPWRGIEPWERCSSEGNNNPGINGVNRKADAGSS